MGHFCHLLNGRNRGYCWGKISWYHGSPIMPRGYGYDQYPPAMNGWEPYTMYCINDPLLQAEEEGPPT
jgi:hypothetical protein